MSKDADLFSANLKRLQEKSAPLAARMRPRTLDEFVGQEHIVGPGRLLRRAIQADQLSSLIFWGPPGSGKTTLAAIIANTTKSHFHTINAVLAGVKDIREAIDKAQERLKLYGQRTILFVDEVHRFNKAQQDALLPHVENGLLILIGATTENPYFEVIKALVSRSRIFQLRRLNEQDIQALLSMALTDKERGLGARPVNITPEALQHLANVADGDARAALNALELAAATTASNSDGQIVIDISVAEESIQQRAVLYDKDGDAHFDAISAFIKSMRGSDPDAALYWMARMIYAGENPRFIFRRMFIFAAEDIGLADPQALVVVAAAAQAFDYIGLPEGQFHLSEACLYLATAPKSNSAMAYYEALAAVEKEKSDEVPTHLKDDNRDKDGFGHGAGYKYPHAYRDHWVEQQYLPDNLLGHTFYRPSEQGREQSIGGRLMKLREAQAAALAERETTAFSMSSTARPAGQQQWQTWLDRTLALSGERLDRIRDRLFDEAHAAPHHRVLIPQAGNGFLVWEALRRAPDGGVMAADASSEALLEIAARCRELPHLQQPYLIAATVAVLPFAAGFFEAIVGKELLVNRTDRAAIAAELFRLLAPGGVLSFFEPLPALSPPLHRILDRQGLPDEIYHGLERMHEELLQQPLPQFTLNVDGLKATLGEQGFKAIVISRHEEQRGFVFTPDMAREWLDRPMANGMPFREQAECFFDQQALERYHQWLIAHAGRESIAYSTVSVFVTARR